MYSPFEIIKKVVLASLVMAIFMILVGLLIIPPRQHGVVRRTALKGEISQERVEAPINLETMSPVDLTMLYRQSKFAPIKAVENPFYHDLLVIAAARQPKGGVTSCGGAYNVPCYFFLEPRSEYNEQATARFVARYSEDNSLSTIIPMSDVRFITTTTVEFVGFFGDAGLSAMERIQLDTTSGVFKTLERVSTMYDDDRHGYTISTTTFDIAHPKGITSEPKFYPN